MCSRLNGENTSSTLPADQGGFDLVGVAVQRHRRGLGDGAPLPTTGTPRSTPAPRPSPGRARRPASRRPTGPAGSARSRNAPGGGRPISTHAVNSPLSSSSAAAGESPRSASSFGGGVGDLDEELLAHAAKPPLDLAAALRAVRGGVDQPDAELAAGPQQPGVDEGASRCRRRRWPGHRARRARVAARRPGARCPRRTRTGTRPPTCCGRPGRRTGRSCGRRRCGPCNASPTHRSFGAVGLEPAEHAPAGRRRPGPSARGGGTAAAASIPTAPSPAEARRIRTTCAAVRSGFSRFNAAASSSTVVSMRLPGWRVDGASASNPPAR